MAPTKKLPDGKPLVIVESPAKARTIGKILGVDYVIEASVGHVRDLPASAEEIPAEVKKQPWARLGIDIEHDFKPLYVVPKSKREQIKKLKALLANAPKLYLATDEDREGESISWHLVQVLQPRVEVKRLVFHEITKPAIVAALQSPRAIDEDLVEAQEARRLVDRLYGYSVSPLLWRKIRPKLSAGRVQSVAVRLVVEREKERIRFRRAGYWDVKGTFEADQQATFEARLQTLGGQRVATGRDFDPDTGQLRPTNAGTPPLHLDQAAAHALVARLTGKPATVQSLEQKPYTERPSAPFTTSTLQQEAGRKLRFTAQRAMRTAQRLYENGYITYMRTDSTTLSDEALSAARARITEDYGERYVPPQPRLYRTKVANAQEAHEAIRPAGSTFRRPKDVAGELGEDELKVYELIFQRTIASQMKDAFGKRTILTVRIDDAELVANGRTVEFDGFRRAYVEDADDGAQDGDSLLPNVKAGDPLRTHSLEPEGHETLPPARLTEASLVKELEARGIGRPSTYASIIETILARDYVFKKGSALVPTFTAFAVTNLLDKHLPYLIDYEFTAKLEGELDEISNGKQRRLAYLQSFYLGNGMPGLRDRLTSVDKLIDPREICGIPLGNAPDGQLVEVRVGRYGPFLSSGERRAPVPDEMPPDELTLERALELLVKGQEGPRSLGQDPETGLSIFVKLGRFGPYFQLGDPEALGGEKPKMASLLNGMTPETVTLAEAVEVLRLPKTLGNHAKPDGTEAPVVAANGRFGPYVKWGTETRSIPQDESPITVTLARALELLSMPKARGRGAARAAKVLTELGVHPRNGAGVRVLDGRYGPYVTDGTTNATVPKGESPTSLTMVRAVELLDARAERGPVKKRPTRRKAAAAPSTAGKTATAKKPAARKRAKADA